VRNFQAACVLLVLAGSLCARPSPEEVHTEPSADFFSSLGLSRKVESGDDIWKVSEKPSSFAWMTPSVPWGGSLDTTFGTTANPFQQLLNRVAPIEDPVRPAPLPGLIVDPGRWFYKHERAGEMYKRRTKLEVPDANEVFTPYGARNWKAQEKVQIPVPLSLPVAEQLFVYGQFDGSGDALSNNQTYLYGKTGVGVKWSLIARSELQLRYATLLSYADSVTTGRFQERAQPAVEVMARLPLIGSLEIEYTGAAIPAVSRTDTDQLRQELRLALPLRGDNELEFGARYRWDYAQETTPWVDRAQLFLGVKLRH
jgi:hypothetical protein